VEHAQRKLGVSERQACRALGQPRSTQRYRGSPRSDETVLVERMTDLALQYGRYGYRKITWFLQQEGFTVNPKRVERLWRREGLKVPKRQPKRHRLWLNDGSCIRRRAEGPNDVWSYDFVQDRTIDGRAFRILVIVDEFTRECLTLRVARKLSSWDVIECLAELFVSRGLPNHLRSDNGPEFTAKAVRKWLGRLDVTPLFIEPGSPWENGYVESFNARLRDEFLDGEIFYTLTEVRVLTERWRWQYNHVRPHQSLGYRPPAPEARGWPPAASREDKQPTIH
jgi:transposase InsO family protein